MRRGCAWRAPEAQPAWNSRGHFFGAAAAAMRRILVESARRKARRRHGGELERVEVGRVELAAGVALKVIKPGMDSRQVSARCEAERQALALLDHPNIAKILDGGRVGGEGRS